MKKIALCNLTLIALGLLFVLLAKHTSLDEIYFSTIFAFPFLGGIVTILAQKKERSYDYLAVLALFAVFFSFLAVFVFKFYLYASGNFGFIFVWPRIEESFIYLVLISIFVFGGLIGLVIRGVNDIFLPRRRLDLTDLSKRTYFIIITVVVVIMIGGIFYASTLPRDMWICKDGQWVADGDPAYDKPEVACMDRDNDSTGSEINFSVDWGEYTNEEYNFSLDYPTDWNVLESPEHIGPYVAFSDKEIKEGERYPKIKLSLENPRVYYAHMKEFSRLKTISTSSLEKDLGVIRRIKAVKSDKAEQKPFNYSEVAIVPVKIKGHDDHIVLQYYEDEYSERDRWLFDQMVGSFDRN